MLEIQKIHIYMSTTCRSAVICITLYIACTLHLGRATHAMWLKMTFACIIFLGKKMCGCNTLVLRTDAVFQHRAKICI